MDHVKILLQIDFGWILLGYENYRYSHTKTVLVKRITTLKKSECCDSLGITLNKMAVVLAHHKHLWKAMLLNSKCP